MLQALTAIFLCQLAGEAITVATGLPLPGPVIGMALLFALLLIKRKVPDDLGKVGDGLLSHLSLLFVPAGVGVMLHLALIEDAWFALSTALVASTLIAIAVSALVMLGVERLTRRPAEGDGS